MLVKAGDSEIIDRIRAGLTADYPGVQLIDTPFIMMWRFLTAASRRKICCLR